MNEFFSRYLTPTIWSVIKAALFLILGLVVAFIVSKLLKKLVGKIQEKTSKKTESKENSELLKRLVGKLSFLVVFLLFVPGIFQTLGLTEMSAPILNVLNVVWVYLPKLIAAAIVLWIGFLIAGLVRDLLIPVFNKIKLNRLQEKAGIETIPSAKLSNTLAYIVYVLILIPVIITALTVMDIEAISQPAIGMLNTIFDYIPSILAASVIIIIGCMIAKLADGIVEHLLAATGLDVKISKMLDGKAADFVFSKVAGIIVRVVLVIFFVVESLNVLHLEVVSSIGNSIIGYMPYVLAAVLILIACYVCASITDKALKKNGHEIGTLFAKSAIYTLGGFMILNELGVAGTIVNAAFIIVVAAFGVAFAVAFGIGGREFASKMLVKLSDKFNKK